MVVAHIFNSCTEDSEAGISEREANLVYRASSKTAKAVATNKNRKQTKTYVHWTEISPDNLLANSLFSSKVKAMVYT